MRYSRRAAPCMLAALMLAGGAGRFPQNNAHKKSADTGRRSVTEMIGMIPQITDSEDVFSLLRVDPSSDTIYQDGRKAGNVFGMFRSSGGSVEVRACDTLTAAQKAAGAKEETEYLPLDEAAERIGLECAETADGLEISAPFQTKTLIVKSDALPAETAACKSADSWDGHYILQYETEADAYNAYLAYQSDSTVESVEPNRIVCADRNAGGSEIPIESEDPSIFWGWEAVGARQFLRELEACETAGHTVTAAVLDSGLYTDHNWFSRRIAEGGISFINDTDGIGRFDDRHGHGTHVAGTIAGMTRGNVRILPVKILNENGFGSTLQVYCGMMYAAEQHADIVNLSLGGVGISPLMREAAKVLEAEDIPCVVSAGNGANDAEYTHPANIGSVITVSSVLRKKQPDDTGVMYKLSSFSNYGAPVDFAAPGSEIYSAGIEKPDGQTLMNGTSMAAPHVTGCIADLLDYDNTLTVSEICQYLRMNALDLGEPGFDEQYGWGMVRLTDLDFAERTLPAPEASINAGTYSEVLLVALTSAEADADIYYTVDGSVPSARNGLRYDGTSVRIGSTTDLRAVVVKDGIAGRIMDQRYELTASAPVFSEAPGTYDHVLSVEIQADPAAEIYYTTDGTAPDRSSSRYDGTPIALSETTVLKAVAVIGDTFSETTVSGYVIGGMHNERLFRIDNGVLLEYCGNQAEPDLSGLGFTEIGPGAFAGNTTLKTLLLPETVTVIGAHAFEGCSALESIRWTQPVVIGDLAFSKSGLREIDCTQTLQFGSYVFSECKNLRKVILPGTLDTLPDGMFRFCRRLSSLSAEGVTRIGQEALCFANLISPSELNLDFSAITEIGERGLSGISFYGFGQPEPVFASLQKAAPCAIEKCSADSMSFPALENVPANAFRNNTCTLYSFPHAQSIADSAIAVQADVMYGVLFGEGLTSISENAFAQKLPLYLAAPEGSPAKRFASRRGVQFIETPALYLQEENTAFSVQQHSACRLHVMQLGIDCSVRWDVTDADDPDAQQADTGITGNVLDADTSACGSYLYSACLYDSAGRLCDQKDFTVNVQMIPENGTLTDEGIYLVYWPEEPDTFGTYAVSFPFTPPRDGTYFIFANDSSTQTAVYSQAQTEIYTGMSVRPSALTGCTLAAGTTVTVVLTATEPEFTALTVTTERPAESLEDCKLKSNTKLLPFGSDLQPECTVISSLTARTLTEGIDYFVFDEKDESGWDACQYIVGAGLYSGMLRNDYYLYKEFGSDSERCISLQGGAEQYYRITPERSGKVFLYADYPESVYSALAAHSRDAEALFENEIGMKLVNSQLGTCDTFSASESPNRSPYCSAALTAGAPYFVALSAAEDVPELLLFRQDTRPEKLLMFAKPVFSKERRFDGAEKLFLKVLRNERDVRMRENTDYKIYQSGAVPGDVYSVVHGCGEYCGYIRQCCSLLPHSCSDSTLYGTDEIRVNEAFVQQREQTDYLLRITGRGMLTLRPADDSTARFDAVLFRQEALTHEWSYCAAFSEQDAETFQADEGLYRLYLAQYDTSPRSYMIGTPEASDSVLDAEIRTAPLFFTGELLQPELTVTCGGKTLTEFVDYTAEPESDIISCGVYRISVQGIGDYTDSVYTTCTVLPAENTDLPEVHSGSNTVQITEPGEICVYRWKPETGQTCFTINTLPGLDIRIIREDGTVKAMIYGMGYGYCAADTVSEENYYVYASFTDRQRTGTFTFDMIPDGLLLDGCAVEGPARIPAEGGELPAFQVKDGDAVLTEGVDYEIYAYGGEDQYGEAYVLLIGKGRYAGLRQYCYERYPVQLPDIEPAPLKAEFIAEQQRGDPSDLYLYALTAEMTGEYRLTLPDMISQGVTAFLYDADGHILPAGLGTVILEQDEILYILIVTSSLESAYDEEEYFRVGAEMISGGNPVHSEEYGCVFLLDPETEMYVLFGIAEGNTGITLPETFSLDGTAYVFEGITESLLPEIMRNNTIYCEPDGNVSQYCAENGLCFAYPYLQSGVAGDVTGNGTVSSEDAAVLLRLLSESSGMQITAEVMASADMDQDGILTLADADLVFLRVSEGE